MNESPELRVPPHSIEAETCAIGALMLRQSDCVDAMKLLTPSHFYRPAHQIIWSILVSMVERSIPIDLVSSKDELLKTGQLSSIGGIEYLTQIVEGVPSSANATYYAGIVFEKARLRDLIVLGSTLVHDAYATMADADGLSSGAAERLSRLMETGTTNRTLTVYEAARRVLVESESVQAGEIPAALSLGFPQIDDCAGGGVRPGQVIYVGADTSVGKTALVTKWLTNVALRQEAGVKMFSAEMTNMEVGQRMIQIMSGVNGLMIQRGGMQAGEWRNANAAVETMRTWGKSVELTDEPLTVAQMRAEITAMQTRCPLRVGLAIIDYLQIIESAEDRGVRERIMGITRGLKIMAKALMIPIIVPSQFSRGWKKENRPPEIHDLKESGTIGHDGDGIILLHRLDPPQTAARGGSIVWAKVAKWRNGRTTEWEGPGSIRLVFNAPTTDYTEIAQ